MWSLGLEGIIHKVHTTSQVEVIAGTIRYFVINYFDENGRRIHITGKIPINNSVQFLGVTSQAWRRELTFLCHLQTPAEATGWGSVNNSNQDWGGSMFDSTIITNVAWGASTDPCPAYLPQSLVNPHTARRCVRDKLLRRRRQERLISPSNWRNHFINPWVHCQDNGREITVTQ